MSTKTLNMKTKNISIDKKCKSQACHILRKLRDYLLEYYENGEIGSTSMDALYTSVEQLEEKLQPYQRTILFYNSASGSVKPILALNRFLIGLKLEIDHMKRMENGYPPNDWTAIMIKQIDMVYEVLNGDHDGKMFGLIEVEIEKQPKKVVSTDRVPLANTLRKRDRLVREITVLYDEYTNRSPEDRKRMKEVLDRNIDRRDVYRSTELVNSIEHLRKTFG